MFDEGISNGRHDSRLGWLPVNTGDQNLVSRWLPVTTGNQNFGLKVVTGYHWLPEIWSQGVY